MVKILHLSDFHYKKDNPIDFNATANKIAESTKGQSIDFIVFSGDLVFKDYGVDTYQIVFDMFFKPILKNFGLTEERLLIVPGNHDMNRDDELQVITDALSNIKNNEELERFCNSKDQIMLSMNRFINFNGFFQNLFSKEADVSDFYISYVRNANGKRYGFVGLNSAWRCYDSIKDRGNLLFPMSQAREAFLKVKDCDIIFCAMHHNFSDFKDFIAQDLEDVVNDNAHVLFTGHYHKMGAQAISTGDIGIIHSIAPATYNRGDKSSQYGYCILDIDEDELELKETPYYLVNGEFANGKTRCLQIPMSEDKKKINDFRKLIRRKTNEAIHKADDLFVYGKGKEEYQTFTNLFKEPIIKDKSVQEIIASRNSGNRVSLDSILKSEKSIIIFGHDKCGKTSLLYKLLIESLKNYNNSKVLPLYVDVKKINKDVRVWNIKENLRKYYELNRRDTEELIESNKILLLIDNVNLSDASFINDFLSQFPDNNRVKYIACAEETMSSQCALMNFTDKDVLKYYIHDITQTEVHQLTCSWPNIAKERRQEIEEKIIRIFSQMHIPFNFWTTSLFLWILERTDESNIHNNFELINLYVDEILGKNEFVFNNEITVEYEDVKSYLASLAKFILYKNYYISEKDLLDFTNQYHNTHKKFTISVIDIINVLINKNIIININEDKQKEPSYTFRLKGLLEYFLAYKMKEEPAFRDEILNDKSYFFGFGNEIELYAGFQKKDEETIDKVFTIVKDILSPMTQQKNYVELDARLNACLEVKPINVQLVGDLWNRLSAMNDNETEDAKLYLSSDTIAVDDSKVVPKKRFENYELNSGNVEKALFILSRVYRNSKICDNENKSEEILSYILDGVCNLGFMLVDDAKNIDLYQDPDTTKNMIQMVSNYMPIIIEAYLYDAISQRNLIRVFQDILKNYISSPENNEFRIFLLTLVLVDLDVKGNLEYLKQNLRYLKMRPIRFAIVSKLLLLTIQYSDNIYIKNNIKILINDLKDDFDGFQQLNENIEKRIILDTNKKLLQKRNREKDFEK